MHHLGVHNCVHGAWKDSWFSLVSPLTPSTFSFMHFSHEPMNPANSMCSEMRIWLKWRDRVQALCLDQCCSKLHEMSRIETTSISQHPMQAVSVCSYKAALTQQLKKQRWKPMQKRHNPKNTRSKKVIVGRQSGVYVSIQCSCYPNLPKMCF